MQRCYAVRLIPLCHRLSRSLASCAAVSSPMTHCRSLLQKQEAVASHGNILQKKKTFHLRYFPPVSPPWLDATNRQKTVKWICRAPNFHFRLRKNNFFLKSCYFFQLSKSYKCEEKNRTISYLWTVKLFMHPSLYPISLETKLTILPGVEVKSRPSDYFITAVAAIVVDSITLGRIHPPVTSIRSTKRLHLRWWLQTQPSDPKEKKKPKQKQRLLPFAVVRMQRTTKSRSKTFLAVWWRMQDTGKCLCAFFLKASKSVRKKKSLAAGSHSVHVRCCVTVCFF